ncbi:MAG: RDD family protein [Coriobacteriia bacterium]|nr:RDD family protein [Coriobacteriia bacterium]
MGATVFDDRLTVETPEAVAFDLELAGVGSRGVAFVIDQLFVALAIAAEALLLVLLVVLLTATGLTEAFSEDAFVYGAIALGVVLVFLTGYGYHIFFEVRRNGRTPGKRIAGIRVVREGGGRVSFGTSATRNLLRIVDALPSAYLVGILAVLLSRQRQRVGDMAAGTVVVYEPKERPLEIGDTLVSEKTELGFDYLRRRDSLTAQARDVIAREVLLTLGETADPAWDEPTVAGRVAQIIGAAPVPEAPAEPDPEAPAEPPLA